MSTARRSYFGDVAPAPAPTHELERGVIWRLLRMTLMGSGGAGAGSHLPAVRVRLASSATPDSGRRATATPSSVPRAILWPPRGLGRASHARLVADPVQDDSAHRWIPWSENIIGGSLRRPNDLLSETTAIPSRAAAPLRFRDVRVATSRPRRLLDVGERRGGVAPHHA